MEPFESATVYLSGQEYTTASCLPQVVKGLQRCFETSSGKAFLSTAIKGITESWGTLNNTISKKDLEKDPILLAAPLDPRYRKMTFMKKKKKEVLFDRWCLACKADSLSSVRDLMLVEEFRNCVPERTVVYLKEQKLTTLQHAATLADEFILTHRNVFPRCDSLHRDSNRKVGDTQPVVWERFPSKLYS